MSYVENTLEALKTDNDKTLKGIISKNGKLLKAYQDKDGQTFVYIAARNNRVKCLKLLIEEGCDVNQTRTTDGATPVFIAAYKGQVEAPQPDHYKLQ